MIDPEEFVERLCLVAAHRGPRGFPRKQRDRLILIKSILMQMDSGRTYTESEINGLLAEWNREIAPAIETDVLNLRRTLVDSGHLERTPDGGQYRVGFPPGPAIFDLEVDQIDARATVSAFIDYARSRDPKQQG